MQLLSDFACRACLGLMSVGFDAKVHTQCAVIMMRCLGSWVDDAPFAGCRPAALQMCVLSVCVYVWDMYAGSGWECNAPRWPYSSSLNRMLHIILLVTFTNRHMHYNRRLPSHYVSYNSENLLSVFQHLKINQHIRNANCSLWQKTHTLAIQVSRDGHGI